MTHDGLTNPFTGKQMINEASEVGNELEITRADMDRWAARSHQLAAKATDEGRLAEEIVSVTVKSPQGRDDGRGRRGDPARHDASSRWPSCAPSAATTRPTPRATRRASTTAPRAVVVASERVGRGQRRAPLGTGPRPTAPSPTTSPTSRRTPAKAAKQALEKIGSSADEVDLWEINEAFASVALNSVRMLGVDEDKVNVNGGAIALGHPIGASGARIVGALVHELRRRGGGLGCAAICSGGGQGDAIVLEVDGA